MIPDKSSKILRKICVCTLGAILISCAGTGFRDTPAALREDTESQRAPPGGTAGSRRNLRSLDRSLPPDLLFIPRLPSLPAPAPGAGAITRNGRDPAAALEGPERAALSEAFRGAYTGALLRGLALEGVLGGDEVHGWPPAAPRAWVQNWRSADVRPNSWGIPSLVLAIRGMEGRGVFVVQGAVLDFYGRSAGLEGANGAAGYGAPRGNEFFFEGGLAQRFDFGLIALDFEGKGIFYPGEPPSASGEIPEDTGLHTGGPSPNHGGIRDAFRSAYGAAVDRGYGPLSPDGPVEYLALAPRPLIPGDSPAPGKSPVINGFYYQSFNGVSTVLILTDSPGLPPGALVLDGPFLDALLAAGESRLSGAETLVPEDRGPQAGEPLGAALLRGFSLYGIPLTDPFPRRTGEASPSYREVQVFSRGWMQGS